MSNSVFIYCCHCFGPDTIVSFDSVTRYRTQRPGMANVLMAMACHRDADRCFVFNHVSMSTIYAQPSNT